MKPITKTMTAFVASIALLALANPALSATKKSKKTEKKAVPTMKYTLDTSASKAVWTGKKVTGSHTGTVKFKEGHFDVANNTIQGGEVVIDMTSIADDDLKDADYNKKLVGHLKSADFFDVEKFPTATFKIKSFSEIHNFVPGQPNAEIKGDLTLHGVTKPETVKMIFTPKGEGFEAKGKFTVDRTQYGLKYNSKKFFDAKALGDKLINDQFEVDLELVAKKEGSIGDVPAMNEKKEKK